MSRLPIATACLAAFASVAFAQSSHEVGSDAERRWMAEHPDALRALGAMPREDAAKFFDSYQHLSPAEQQKLRDHAGEIQGLGPQERTWALDNPDAMRQLGNLSDADRKKILESYQDLSPAEQQKLREHANELQSLSPEERQWALDHPDAVRQLGNLPDGQAEQMLDAYRHLPPETQEMVRDRMGGGR